MVKRNKNSNNDLESISKADSALPGRDCMKEQTQLSRHNITATTEEREEIVRSTQTRSDSQHGLQSATSTSRNLTSKRHKWTSEEYQEILRCYFITMEIYSNYPVTKKTYEIWEKRNPQLTNSLSTDPNKLANTRRYIKKNGLIPEETYKKIKNEVVRITVKNQKENKERKFHLRKRITLHLYYRIARKRKHNLTI